MSWSLWDLNHNGKVEPWEMGMIDRALQRNKENAEREDRYISDVNIWGRPKYKSTPKRESYDSKLENGILVVYMIFILLFVALLFMLFGVL